MTTDQEKLFNDLVTASRILTTTCRTAATVLSEEFESMIIGPMDAVNEILDKCPEGGIAWDGNFNEEDVEEGNWDTGIEAMRGIALKHRPSKISVQMTYPSNSVPERVEKVRQSAFIALRRRVDSYVKRQKELGVL